MGNVLTIERSYYDPYPDYLNEMTIQYHGNQIKKVTDESRGHDYYVLRYQDAANKDIEQWRLMTVISSLILIWLMVVRYVILMALFL